MEASCPDLFSGDPLVGIWTNHPVVATLQTLRTLHMVSVCPRPLVGLVVGCGHLPVRLPLFVSAFGCDLALSTRRRSESMAAIPRHANYVPDYGCALGGTRKKRLRSLVAHPLRGPHAKHVQCEVKCSDLFHFCFGNGNVEEGT